MVVRLQSSGNLVVLLDQRIDFAPRIFAPRIRDTVGRTPGDATEGFERLFGRDLRRFATE
jgi:hypothetical protein